MIVAASPIKPLSDVSGVGCAKFEIDGEEIKLRFKFDLDEWEISNVSVQNPTGTEKDFDAVAELEAPDVAHKILLEFREFYRAREYELSEILSRSYL